MSLVDLLEFIRARLTDMEQTAAGWEHAIDSSEASSCPGTRTAPLGDLEWGADKCWCGLPDRVAAVAADVGATRHLTDMVMGWQHDGPCATRSPDRPPGTQCTCCTGHRQFLVLRGVARRWALHPDFSTAWRPPGWLEAITAPAT